jgi:hypothetical protein
MKIQIKDSSVITADIKTDRGSFTTHTQAALALLSDGQVWKVRVRLPRQGDKVQAAYPPGAYEISDDSFGLGKHGDLEMKSLALVPVAAK